MTAKNHRGEFVHSGNKLGMIHTTDLETYPAHLVVRYINPTLAHLTFNEEYSTLDAIHPSEEHVLTFWSIISFVFRVVFGGRRYEIVTSKKAERLKKKYGAWVRVYSKRYYSEDTIQKILSAKTWEVL